MCCGDDIPLEVFQDHLKLHKYPDNIIYCLTCGKEKNFSNLKSLYNHTRKFHTKQIIKIQQNEACVSDDESMGIPDRISEPKHSPPDLDYQLDEQQNLSLMSKGNIVSGS